MARRIALAMVLVAGCSSPGGGVEESPRVVSRNARRSGQPTPASTIPPASTTTVWAVEASRGRTSTSVVIDEAFWRRLADCECASGHCGGGHVGYFQFSADTAAKVSIDGSEGYEEQRAAAIVWAARIHPRENTRSGWPHCWDEAA
jgi:hypothetical protein